MFHLSGSTCSAVPIPTTNQRTSVQRIIYLFSFLLKLRWVAPPFFPPFSSEFGKKLYLSQAETYGFTGSRRFVKDWQEGIGCRNRLKASEAPDGREACLDPLYPSLEFLNLGRPAHVLSVDQVSKLYRKYQSQMFQELFFFCFFE